MGEVQNIREGQEPSALSVVNSRGQLRGAYKPPDQVKTEWRIEGQRRGDTGYSLRWAMFWGRVVRALAAAGTVAGVDMTWVDEYVRRCRLSEMHRTEAESCPYVTYDSGYIAAHPGFAQSRAEAKEARQLAVELGLTPVKRKAAGIDLPAAGVDAAGADEWDDDQTGPDGKPL